MSKQGFQRLFACAAACVLFGVMAVPAVAQNGAVGGPPPAPPYTPGSGWATFSWSGAPGAFNTEGAFTFVSTASLGLLRVTDAFIDGDQFEVYDFGGLIMTTSVPTNTGSGIGADYDGAFASSSWSSGSLSLTPGSHSLTFKTIAIATGFSGGGAAFSVVPEPASLLTFALGAVFVMGRRRG